MEVSESRTTDEIEFINRYSNTIFFEKTNQSLLIQIKNEEKKIKVVFNKKEVIEFFEIIKKFYGDGKKILNYKEKLDKNSGNFRFELYYDTYGEPFEEGLAITISEKNNYYESFINYYELKKLIKFLE